MLARRPGVPELHLEVTMGRLTWRSGGESILRDVGRQAGCHRGGLAFRKRHIRCDRYPMNWIDAQLSHADPHRVSATDNHARYLAPRRRMMQDWADRLDLLE